MRTALRLLARTSVRTLLAVVVWVGLFGPSLAQHARNSANPRLFNDDVRQQVWPFFRYSDGGFTRDYIGGYYLHAFLPAGYRAVFAAVAHVVDPVTTSKVVPYALFALTLALCALAARRLQGTAAFLGCGLLCLSSGILFARMVGGLPRGFGYPIVALATYGLAAGNVWWVAAAVVAGALFYPAVAVPPGAALALWLLLLPRRDRAQAQDWSLARRFAFLACVAVVAGLLVLPTALGARRYGRLLTPADARAYPEMMGRYAPEDRAPTEYFFPTFATAFRSGVVGSGPPFIAAWSVRARPNESRVLWSLAAVVALGLPLLCVRSGAARRLSCLLVAACAAFVAAKEFAPYLYLPQRHLLYVVPLLAVVLVPASASAFGALLPGGAARYAAPALALAASIAALLALGGTVAPRTGLYIELPANERVYGFLATLPRSALIAGLPDALMDNVPYVSRRQVLVTYETHQVFHTRYVQEMRRRVRAVVAATFAADYAPIASLRDKFHVTHLVVNRAHYGTAPPRYFAQFGRELRKAYASCADHSCIIAKGVPAAEVFQQGTIVVLDLSKLPPPESGGVPAH